MSSSDRKRPTWQRDALRVEGLEGRELLSTTAFTFHAAHSGGTQSLNISTLVAQAESSAGDNAAATPQPTPREAHARAVRRQTDRDLRHRPRAVHKPGVPGRHPWDRWVQSVIAYKCADAILLSEGHDPARHGSGITHAEERDQLGKRTGPYPHRRCATTWLPRFADPIHLDHQRRKRRHMEHRDRSGDP